MLDLPWWIFGTAPDEEDAHDNTQIIETSAVEVQESMPSTPVSIFETPSASPFLQESDSIPSVIDLPTFLKVAKRRSSTVIEKPSPKIMKSAKNSSFERKETEIMNRADESFSFSEDHNETFALIGNFSRPASPMPMDKSDESLADKSALILESSVEEIAQRAENSFLQSPTREFPMFFTSFNDTTVLFNTTINGDYERERLQNNDAVGDWVFKGNKYLQENMSPEKAKKDTSFKQPVVRAKKSRGKPRNHPETPSRGPKANKKEKEAKPSSSSDSVPIVMRRQTPSRKAKTYKSMRED